MEPSQWLASTGQSVTIQDRKPASVEMGADAFACRAQAELAATGEKARKRSVETRQTLTAQEAQVARLVAEGGTNRDEVIPSFWNTFRRWYSTVAGLMNNWAATRTQLARMLLTET